MQRKQYYHLNGNDEAKAKRPSYYNQSKQDCSTDYKLTMGVGVDKSLYLPHQEARKASSEKVRIIYNCSPVLPHQGVCKASTNKLRIVLDGYGQKI